MHNQNAKIAAECRAASTEPHMPRRARVLLQRAADALDPPISVADMEFGKPEDEAFGARVSEDSESE